MGTKGRKITTAIAFASLLGITGVAALAGTEGGGAALSTTGSASAPASADALERRTLLASKPAPDCDTSDFTGSADAYERQSAPCVEPVIVLYGSPDTVERQGGR